MSSLGKVLVALALALIAGALILGLRPISSESGFDCGNAFFESDDLGADEMFDAMTGGDGESGCDKARSDAQPWPIVLGVLGLAAFGAVVAIGREDTSPNRAED